MNKTSSMKPYLESALQENGQLRQQSIDVEQAVGRAEVHLSALRYGLEALQVEFKLLEHDFAARRQHLWALLDHIEAMEQRLAERRGEDLPVSSSGGARASDD